MDREVILEEMDAVAEDALDILRDIFESEPLGFLERPTEFIDRYKQVRRRYTYATMTWAFGEEVR